MLHQPPIQIIQIGAVPPASTAHMFGDPKGWAIVAAIAAAGALVGSRIGKGHAVAGGLVAGLPALAAGMFASAAAGNAMFQLPP